MELPISTAALAYLGPEIEHRLKFIVQESWKVARRSRRAVLLPEDVTAAYATLSGNHGAPWRPMRSVDDCALVSTTQSLRLDARALLPGMSFECRWLRFVHVR